MKKLLFAAIVLLTSCSKEAVKPVWAVTYTVNVKATGYKTWLTVGDSTFDVLTPNTYVFHDNKAYGDTCRIVIHGRNSNDLTLSVEAVIAVNGKDVASYAVCKHDETVIDYELTYKIQ